MKILQFVLTSQAKYIQPELRKQRDKIEANVVEKWMINARRMPELASHLAISGAFQVQKRLLLWHMLNWKRAYAQLRRIYADV